MNDHNIALDQSNCITHIKHIFSSVYTNICNGETTIIANGTVDIIAYLLLCVVFVALGVSFLLILGAYIKDAFF